jgi:hypothetical protein
MQKDFPLEKNGLNSRDFDQKKKVFQIVIFLW